MKSVGIFILKSVAFSVIFWTISGLVLFSFYNFNNRASRASSSTVTAAQSEQNDGAAMTQKYWSQAAETDAMQANLKKQQAQSAEQLNKQSELLVRWEKVIQRWEHMPAK